MVISPMVDGRARVFGREDDTFLDDARTSVQVSVVSRGTTPRGGITRELAMAATEDVGGDKEDSANQVSG